MRAITDQQESAGYQKLLSGLTDPMQPQHLRSEWLADHGWIVVPVEDTAHFALEELHQFLSVLRGLGYTECIAIATELVAPGPEVYRVPLSEEGFRSFNAECGMLRYLLTVEDRSWAISCGEWFNLFAGPPVLVERMLGRPISAARAEFMEYALLLAGGTNDREPALIAARRYSLV